MQAHRPVVVGRLPWLVCSDCGLIYLKNEATRRATRRPCPGA